MTCRLTHATVLLVLAAGCGGGNPDDDVIAVTKNDPRMNAAIKKSRETVQTFITALQSPKTGQSSFEVKMAFTDGIGTEHMWLWPVTFDGKCFQGTVDNDAFSVTNVKKGQNASVEPSDISDWMFIENGMLKGGYTVRILRDPMSAQERAEYDKSVQFDIE